MACHGTQLSSVFPSILSRPQCPLRDLQLELVLDDLVLVGGQLPHLVLQPLPLRVLKNLQLYNLQLAKSTHTHSLPCHYPLPLHYHFYSSIKSEI